MGEKGIGDFILKILSELLTGLGNFVAYVVEKVNEAVPPEIRVLGLVLLLLCYCCCRCCSKKDPKMMKAPGRNYRMPRATFESDPKSYFRDIRGKPKY